MQTQGPAPEATVRLTVRLNGRIVGYIFANMTMQEWYELNGRPFANPGDLYQTASAGTDVIYEWIAPQRSMSAE